MGLEAVTRWLSCPAACGIKPRDQTHVLCIDRQILNQWTTREVCSLYNACYHPGTIIWKISRILTFHCRIACTRVCFFFKTPSHQNQLDSSGNCFLLGNHYKWIHFDVAVVQSLSHVQLFAAPWIVASQASLSSIISWSLLRFMSLESVMLSNHLIPCQVVLLPSILASIRVFSNESALGIR